VIAQVFATIATETQSVTFVLVIVIEPLKCLRSSTQVLFQQISGASSAVLRFLASNSDNVIWIWLIHRARQAIVHFTVKIFNWMIHLHKIWVMYLRLISYCSRWYTAAFSHGFLEICRLDFYGENVSAVFVTMTENSERADKMGLPICGIESYSISPESPRYSMVTSSSIGVS
jgi:hypothetical protein